MTSLDNKTELWQLLDRVDPYPAYSYLRGRAGLYFDEEEGLFVASRYSDVDAVLRHPKFSPGLARDFLLSSPNNAPDLRAHYDKWMVFSSGQNHTVQRRLFSGRKYADLSQAAVRDAIASINFEAECASGTDLVKSLIDPLVGRYITKLLGVSPDREARLRGFSTSLISPLNGLTDINSLQSAEAAMAGLRELIEKPSEADGVISMLAAATEAGEISTEQALASIAQILTGAIEPAAFALGNALVALLTNPDELRLLVAAETSLEEALDELLRFDAPFQYVPRMALEEAVIADTVVPEGVRVICLLASANHDGTEFAAAHQLKIQRRPRRVAAFGLGPHTCLGTRGAKELLAAGLEAFVAVCRANSVELLSASRLASIGIRGFTSVIITASKSKGIAT